MHASNVWGGTLEVQREKTEDEDEREDWDRASLLYQQKKNQQNGDYNELDEVQQSWLLAPQESRKSRKNRYVDLGCIIVSKKALKWAFWSFFVVFVVVVMPIIIAKTLPKHKPKPPPPDDYTLALQKALLFFNAQKCESSLSFLSFFFFKKKKVDKHTCLYSHFLNYEVSRVT